MNFTTPLRRTIAVAALLSSFAGAVGAAGAAHADSTTPAEPTPVEAPVEPITQDAPPGPVDGGDVAAPTTTTPPPVETDPVTTPAPTEPEAPTPPPVETPTTSPQGGKPPVTTTPSAIATVTTTPAAVTTVVASATASTAPQSLVATPGNQSVKLSWKAPASNGGAPIDKYAVQVYSGAVGWKNIAFPTTLSYTASGLTNGTKYSYRILAHNAAGWSAPSAGVTAVPRTVPSAPLSPAASPGNQSVTLSWKLPASTGGAPVISYTVEWATSTGGPWQYFGNAYQLSYKASSAYFANGTRYYFRIRANNAAGSSVPTAAVSAVPRTVPAMVPFCNAVSQGHYDDAYGDTVYPIYVKWQAPASNGAPIDYYTVEFWKNGTFYISYTKPAPLVDGFFKVYSAGIYQVRVSAHNAAGNGSYCSQSVGAY